MDTKLNILQTLSILSDLSVFYSIEDRFTLLKQSKFSDSFMELLVTKVLPHLPEKSIDSKGFNTQLITSAGFSFIYLRSSFHESLGPFFQSEACKKEAVRFLEEYGTQDLLSEIHLIQQKEKSFIDTVIDLINEPISQFGSSESTPIKIIQKLHLDKSTLSVFRLDPSSINLQNEIESQIRKLILEGDKIKLKKLFDDIGSNRMFKVRHPMNKLRDLKNYLITLNTIFRLTAKSGKVPAIMLSTISRGLLTKIEDAKDVQSLIGIRELAINEYCNLIKNVGAKNNSYPVVRVKRYILENLDKQLELGKLADIAGISPVYLSRLFRKECNMTITDYIRGQRIEEAKWRLINEDIPTSEISDALGFQSQSYFCRTFKKETGINPTDYRRMNKT